MKTKAILNDDGNLTVLASVEIVFSNGRVLRGKRTGNAYSSNVRSNINRMFHNAIMDCVYQVMNDNNVLPYRNGTPIGSGELLDDYAIDYKVINYEVNYITREKAGRVTYKTKNYKYKNKSRKYIVKYTNDKYTSRERYSYVSNKELSGVAYLDEDTPKGRTVKYKK